MLKQQDDGLTKVWKKIRVQEPFFQGSKILFNNNEDRLICHYNDNIKIVNWLNGEIIASLFDDNDETKEKVTNFCINGNNLVVSTSRFLLHHYTIDDNNSFVKVRTIKGHQMPILTMEYDITGTLVATGSADKTVKVWDIDKGYCTHNFKDHSHIIQTVKFHNDHDKKLKLFSCSEDCSIRVYDLLSSSCVACFKEHLSLPTSISFNPKGTLFVSGSRDKVLNFYSLEKLEHIKTIAVMEEIEGVQILKDEHSSQILKINSKSNKAKDSKVQNVLVTGGKNGAVKIYKIEMVGRDKSTFAYELLLQIPLSNFSANVGQSNSISTLLYLPVTGEIIAATADYNFNSYTIDSISSIYNGTDDNKSRVIANRQIVGCNDDILDITFIPRYTNNDDEDDDCNKNSNEFTLAMATNSPLVRLMDESFSCSLLDGHTDIVLSVDASPNGKFIVTSSKDTTCRIWNVDEKLCCGIAKGHVDAVGAVCMSKFMASYKSKQVFMVSGGSDKILKRWDLPLHNLKTNKLTELTPSHSVRAHEKDVNAVAISPNDSIIASGSQDKSIRLWRSTDLTAIASLKGHKRGIWRLVFSPIDKTLASTSGDRTVRLWSMVDHSCLRTFEGHTASVLCVDFINKGTQLLSGSADGLIRLWTIRTGECENTFDEHQDKVWTICSNLNDDSTFFSGGSDSRFIVWKDCTEETENDRLKSEEETLLLEQKMHNDIRNKRFGEAIKAALSLGHSFRLLTVLTAILEDDDKADIIIAERLDPYISAWSDEDLEKVVIYAKDWNTNARYCFTSQIVINSIIRLHKVDHVMSIKGVSEAIPAILSYSERHFQRIDKLYQASYLLEYMSSLMSLLPNETNIKGDVDNNRKITKDIEKVPMISSKPKIFQSSNNKRKNQSDDLADYNRKKNNDNNNKKRKTITAEVDNDPFFS